MSFGIYTIGTLVLVVGVAYICHAAHLPSQWTVGLCILLLGAGIMGGVSSTRQKDSN